jgi:hypothetical protein
MAIDTTGDAFPAPTRITGNLRGNVKGLWFFAALWNVVSVPLLVFIPSDLERQPLAALGFLFPIVGAGLIVWAVITTARWRRFGNTWLDTPSGPARPGNTWRATIHTRLPRHEGLSVEPLRLKLTCLQRTISRHGDDRDERERILWREETELDWSRIGHAADGAAIPVQFDIPADALQTTAVGKGEGILWVLTAEAALHGVDFKEDFDVPVRGTASDGSFAFARSARGASRQDSADCRSASRTDLADKKDPQPRTTIALEDLARTGITVEPAPDGTTITFAPMRNMSFAFGVAAFTTVWTGALWVQWHLGFPWVFPILTGLVDLLLVYVVADLWLGKTVVTAGNGMLRVCHTVLGAGGSRLLAAAEIASIDLHISMQAQGHYGTPYYELRARLMSGRKVTLGGGVRNKRHAEWLAAQMRNAIGLSSN